MSQRMCLSIFTSRGQETGFETMGGAGGGVWGSGFVGIIL
jgi:hypothetical protein